MFSGLYRISILGIALLSLSTSCEKKEIDTDILEDLKWPIGVDLPLLQTSIGLKPIVDSSEFLQVQPDGLIFFSIEEDLFEYSLSDITGVFDQKVLDTTFSSPNTSSGVEILIEDELNVLLSRIDFAEGSLRVRVTPIAPTATVDVDIEFLNLQQNGNPLIATFSTSTFEEKIYSLPQYSANFLSNNGTPNTLLMSLVSQSVSPQAYQIEIWIENTVVSYIEGDFGDESIDTLSQEIGLSLEDLDFVTEGIEFTDPSITINYSNGFGIGANGQLNLFALDSMNNVLNTLNNTTLSIPRAQTQGTPITGNIVWDRNNTNFSSFFDTQVQAVRFDGTAQVTDDVVGNNFHFLDSGSRLEASATVKVPLVLTVDSLLFSTEIELSDGISPGEDESIEISEAEIRFDCTNDFPLSGTLEFVLQDSLDIPIDTLFVPLLQASAINSIGETTSPANYQFSIALSGDDLDALSQVRKGVFHGLFDAPQNNSQEIRILDSYTIGLDVSVRFSGELSQTN